MTNPMTDITLEKRARDILQDEYQRTHAANPKCNLDEATWGLAHRAVTQALRLSAGADDTRRLDWLDDQVSQHGDGYHEPREAGWFLEWQQARPGEYWQGVRWYIDAEMAKNPDDDLLAAAPRHETGEGSK